jgi:hypothetical protein
VNDIVPLQLSAERAQGQDRRGRTLRSGGKMGKRVSAGNCVWRVFVGVSDQPGARLAIISEMSEVVETREEKGRTREKDKNK